MPFPIIKHCIVCTGIKPEGRGKLTILGFFGLSPDVFIDTTLPGNLELVFLMVGGPGDGKLYQVVFEIVDEAGNPILPPQSPDFLMPSERKTYLIFETPANYRAPGKYRCRAIVDGRVHHEALYELFRTGG